MFLTSFKTKKSTVMLTVEIRPDSMARSKVSARADATTSDSLSGTAKHTECSLEACARAHMNESHPRRVKVRETKEQQTSWTHSRGRPSTPSARWRPAAGTEREFKRMKKSSQEPQCTSSHSGHGKCTHSTHGTPRSSSPSYTWEMAMTLAPTFLTAVKIWLAVPGTPAIPVLPEPRGDREGERERGREKAEETPHSVSVHHSRSGWQFLEPLPFRFCQNPRERGREGGRELRHCIQNQPITRPRNDLVPGTPCHARCIAHYSVLYIVL